MIRTDDLRLSVLFAALAATATIVSGLGFREATACEPVKTPSATAPTDADAPSDKAVLQEAIEEFPFDKLIVKIDSFVAHENQTLIIQKDGSYVLQPHASPDYTASEHSSKYRLSNAVMVELDNLLKVANYLKEPPIEEKATDSEKGIIDLIERTRAGNPQDPAIRHYEATIRAGRLGIPMVSDGTWFTFTLVRNGKQIELSRYAKELTLPTIRPLVGFINRIVVQEAYYQQLEDLESSRNDPLLELNLHLDDALGRRNRKNPPELLPLEFARIADRLQEIAEGDDRRAASRAQRAIRTIAQLPSRDFVRPSPPIPPGDADRLATFRGFWLHLKGDGDESPHLAISPDGWYEFWITGPLTDSKHHPVLYRHVDRLPRETLDRLDELITATKYFRSAAEANVITGLSEREVFELAAEHESMAVIHDSTMRRIVSDRAPQAEEYVNLREFLTTQIARLMKRWDAK